MRAKITIPVLAAAMALFFLFPAEGRGELVKRSMYTDASGKTVSQYVYQGGKSKRSSYSRSRSYGYGYSPYYRGGVYGSGTYLHARPRYSRHGHRGHGHVHGSYSSGNFRVHFRW